MIRSLLFMSITLSLVGCAAPQSPAARSSASHHQPAPAETASMNLGNFSVSLSVRDIAASRAFYETLGFRAVGGEQEHNWLIMANRGTKIGLFQGMFEGNILTDPDSNTITLDQHVTRDGTTP